MARALQRLLGLSALLGAVACSFIVDTDEIDQGCAPGTKYCEGRCVDVKDATYGCTPRECDPCQNDGSGDPFGDRFIPKCDNGECVVDRCAFDYGCEDCDRHLLTDEDNCGACMNPCPMDWTCRVGVCVPGDGAGGNPG